MGANLRRVRTAAVLLLLGLGLSACVAMGAIDRSAGTIDRSVGTARNTSILLNIVRASRQEPLYFYSISRVSGSGTEDFKFSLPAVSVGPNRTVAQKNYTFGLNGLNVLDNQRSGSFDVALLESKNFYQGMLAPLDLLEINLLLKQGFPRELVYRLAVQDVTVYDEKGLHRYLNDPSSNSYLVFNVYMAAAMSHGITTETFLQQGPAPHDAAGGGGADKSKAGGEAGGLTPGARLCVDPTLVSDPKAMDDVSQSGNECGKRPVVLPAADTTNGALDFKAAYDACSAAGASPSADAQHNRVCAHLNGKVIITQLNTRSLFGIFQYLGGLVATGADVPLKHEGTAAEVQADGTLLRVTHDRQDCFAALDWDQHYCVPRGPNKNLREVFSIINALQALKTAPGDLPATQAVRIEQ
jgi:hypothetical protein